MEYVFYFLYKILFVYIRYVAYLNILIVILAKLESHFSLKKESFKIKDGWYATSYIKPPILRTGEQNIRLSDCLFHKYKLLVFNFSYMAVSGVNYIQMLEIFLKKRLAAAIFFYIIGIPRLLLTMLLIFLNFYKKSSYQSFLYDYFEHCSDDRKLFKINNVWYHNGNFDFLKKIIKNLNLQQSSEIELKNKLISYSKQINSLDMKEKSFKAIITDSKTLTKKHTIITNIVKNNNLSIQTDYGKAKNNDFYSKDQVVNKYQSDTKPATLLEQNPNNIIQTSNLEDFKTSKLLLGALHNGYNENLLMDKHVRTANEIEIIMKGINNLVMEYKIKDLEPVNIFIMLNDESFNLN